MSITILFIIINIAVFFTMELLGDTESAEFMIEHGGIYPPAILKDGEYWRLLSATFLHFGFDHLLSNMVMLGAAGQILERALGKVKFAVLYLASGIGGSLLSYTLMVLGGDYAVAAGASGAIFGIIGALAWIVIVHKGQYETLTGKGIALMIALCLLFGVTTGNVDNWGHIGGLLMGFLMGMILYRRDTKQVDFTEENLYTYSYDENNTGEVEDED